MRPIFDGGERETQVVHVRRHPQRYSGARVKKEVFVNFFFSSFSAAPPGSEFNGTESIQIASALALQLIQCLAAVPVQTRKSLTIQTLVDENEVTRSDVSINGLFR